jgi:hypothetical protein
VAVTRWTKDDGDGVETKPDRREPRMCSTFTKEKWWKKSETRKKTKSVSAHLFFHLQPTVLTAQHNTQHKALETNNTDASTVETQTRRRRKKKTKERQER